MKFSSIGFSFTSLWLMGLFIKFILCFMPLMAWAQDTNKPDTKANNQPTAKPIKIIANDYSLPPESDTLGLFFKGGFAVIIPFDEEGFYRGNNDDDDSTTPSNHITNSFTVGYAPSISLGYDFNQNYSAEANFMYYGNSGKIYLTDPAVISDVTFNNYIFTIDQSYHGISVWQFSFPLRLGVGVLFWQTEDIVTKGLFDETIPNPDDLDKAGNNILLKIGTGVKFNIVRDLSIFSTMDVELRFDYYFVFGDRRNTNRGAGSELLLAKDFASGNIGSVIADFKLGF
ncbi:MAG: hypothetical protein ACR2NY_06510 [Alphaproteobacteria bacterium]